MNVHGRKRKFMVVPTMLSECDASGFRDKPAADGSGADIAEAARAKFG